MGHSERPKNKGGFNFEDREPVAKARFQFSVEAVSEDELKRRGKREGKPERAPIERVREGADPGGWEWPTLGAVLVLLALVIWLQQWSRYLQGETLSDAPVAVRTNETPSDPGVGEFTVMSKLAVKLAYVHEELGRRRAPGPLSEEEPPKKEKSGAKKPAPAKRQVQPVREEQELRIRVEDLERIAWSRVERLRVAFVAGELDGARAALERIGVLEREAEEGGDLAAELHWARLIYEKGPGAIPVEAAEALESRHGWFGRLAVSFGKHASDPVRWEVVSGGSRIAVVMVMMLGILGLVSVAGLAVCIVAGVRLKGHGYTMRFEPPSPGGSVYLETFGIFLAGFALLLLIELMLFGLGVEGTHAAAGVNQVLLWGLVVTVVWPRVRGVGWGEWASSMGLHRGAGVMPEILAGVLAYLAAQPLLRVGQLVGGVVEKVTDTAPAEASFGYGMFEAPAQGAWFVFILGVLSAVVWAPIVEECIFRGALFRYLTGRMSIVWAVVVSAALFGAIHPYTTSGLVEVAVMGVAFGVMRRWRGSLIAPITAHALHNGLVSSMSVGLIAMLGD